MMYLYSCYVVNRPVHILYGMEFGLLRNMVSLWIIFPGLILIVHPMLVWWPYTRHAKQSPVPSAFSSLYLCIISPGTVTLDVIAQSQMLWILSPKLVTNEALLETMSNIQGLFLITLCLPLHHPFALRQQCPFALLSDRFWRRIRPDCTVFRSVDELICHFIQTNPLSDPGLQRIRLMLMNRFVPSHVYLIISSWWDFKCQILGDTWMVTNEKDDGDYFLHPLVDLSC